MKFACNGRIKRSNETISFLASTLSVSPRSIQGHIDFLEENGYLNYDKATRTLFLHGWGRVCRKHGVNARRGVCIKLSDLKNLKAQLFAACALNYLKAAKTYKKRSSEYSSLEVARPRRIDVGNSSNMRGRTFLVNGYQDYLGVSCSLTSAPFNRSLVWSSRMKQAARKAGLLRHDKMLRVVVESATPINVKAVSFSFPLIFHKCVQIKVNGRYVIAEKMADQMETNVVVVRKRISQW